MQLVIIQQKIVEVRGKNVLLDFELASLYNVPTKALNQGVKRNADRFPKDFMFRLTAREWKNMRSQFVTASQERRNARSTPYAFTEHGVAMLASVLKSKKAIQMNIAIVKAFIALRKLFLEYKELSEQIKEIRRTVLDHNEQLHQIYNAIGGIMQKKEQEVEWRDRERIGFKSKKS